MSQRSNVVTVDILKPNYNILRDKAKVQRYSVKEYINKILESTIQKERFLERYAPYLSVLHFIYDRVTLEDKNPKAKVRFIDVKVRDHELICEKDERTDCIHCHFVWAIPEIAKLNLKKPPEPK